MVTAERLWRLGAVIAVVAFVVRGLAWLIGSRRDIQPGWLYPGSVWDRLGETWDWYGWVVTGALSVMFAAMVTIERRRGFRVAAVVSLLCTAVSAVLIIHAVYVLYLEPLEVAVLTVGIVATFLLVDALSPRVAAWAARPPR